MFNAHTNSSHKTPSSHSASFVHRSLCYFSFFRFIVVVIFSLSRSLALFLYRWYSISDRSRQLTNAMCLCLHGACDALVCVCVRLAYRFNYGLFSSFGMNMFSVELEQVLTHGSNNINPIWRKEASGRCEWEGEEGGGRVDASANSFLAYKLIIFFFVSLYQSFGSQ